MKLYKILIITFFFSLLIIFSLFLYLKMVSNKFNKLNIGMQYHEVELIMGKPNNVRNYNDHFVPNYYGNLGFYEIELCFSKPDSLLTSKYLE